MMRSMFAGVSGLRSHQTMMDVVGNNIANVNTVGFKSSRTLFIDTISQLIRGSSGGANEVTAGINPQQVGLGVRVGAIDIIHTQGGSQLTGKATDVSIQGDGFFVLNFGGEQVYSRAGAFSFDQNGFLVDPTGAIVQGWLSDTTGAIVTSRPVTNLQLPVSRSLPPVTTTTVEMKGNLAATTLTTDPAIETSIDVVDGQGTKHTMTFAWTKNADNDWTVEAFDPADNSLGTANVLFDPSTGELDASTVNPTFTYTPPGGTAFTFTLDLGVPGSGEAVTQFGSPTSIAAVSQDGSQSGNLRALAIGDDGTVTGIFSDGRTLNLAKLALAKFANPTGLLKAGQSHYQANSSSGDAIVGLPGVGGTGQLASGTLEMSNVDLSQEFTNLIIAQRGFQANSRIISTSDELLQDLVNLKR